MSTETRTTEVNGLSVDVPATPADRGDNNATRQVAAALNRGDERIKTVRRGFGCAAKVTINTDGGDPFRFEAPDGYAIDSVFVSSHGTVTARIRAE